jgi:hypothetical protein
MANSSVQNTIRQRYIQLNETFLTHTKSNPSVSFKSIDYTLTKSGSKLDNGVVSLKVKKDRVSVYILNNNLTGGKFNWRLFESIKNLEVTDNILPGTFIKNKDTGEHFEFDYKTIEAIEIILDPININYIDLIIFTTDGQKYNFLCVDTTVL